MAIDEEDVAAVRAATDLAVLIGEKVGLRPQGRRLVGLCPFHSERSPSFSVDPQSGLYHCFGCGASGDAITFVRNTQQLDFTAAVEMLAARAGISLRTDRRAARSRARRDRAGDALVAAVDWYHERLLSSPDARQAREYLRSRGYGGDVARRFKLGWAPEGWDELCRALGFAADLAKETGLGYTNRAGRLQDTFRGRILFPIFDVTGRPVGFGGRVLPSSSRPQPKYMNSPEGPLYSKRKVLYGLNWAKEEVVREGRVVVCEGYTDVIGFFEAGLGFAVATCGTALAEDHFRLLRGFARKLVLAFDADAAGASAAERVYEWEQRNEIDVAVAELPNGLDPAELSKSQPELLRKAVETAKPYLAFRLERVLSSAALDTAEARARAASASLLLISEHPDQLVRDQYVMVVSDRCRIGADQLRDRLAELKTSNPTGSATRQERPRSQAPRTPTPLSRPAVESLRLLLQDRGVASRLAPALFPEGPTREAFEAAARTESAASAASACGEEAAQLLRRLAVEEVVADPDAITKLILDSGRRALSSMEAEARSDPESAIQLSPVVSWLSRALQYLRENPGSSETEDDVVAWLDAGRREGKWGTAPAASC